MVCIKVDKEKHRPEENARQKYIFFRDIPKKLKSIDLKRYSNEIPYNTLFLSQMK